MARCKTKKWMRGGSNPGPLQCKCSALPLSYAPVREPPQITYISKHRGISDHPGAPCQMDEEADPPTQRLVANISSRVPNVVCDCVQCVVESVCICDLQFLNDHVLPAIETISRHPNIHVISYLMAGLPDFGENLFEYFPDHAESILLKRVFPVVHRVISMVDDNLIDSVSECFAALATLLDAADFVTVELPKLVEFSKSRNKRIRRVACAVLSFLVDFFEPAVWYAQLLEMLGRLTSDSDASVRALVPGLVAGYLGRVTDVKDKAQVCAWMPLFCRDFESDVRQAAAEALLDCATALDASQRFVNVLPCLEVLVNDSSEEIRRVIALNLGKLITLIGDGCDEALVAKYGACLASSDSEVAFAAAFSLPGVAGVLGADRWKELRLGFVTACESMEQKIRRSLAFGLFLYAKFVDPEDLLAAALQFLNDVPEVAAGVIENLREVLDRVNDKGSLQFCLENPKSLDKWRMRLNVSKQLRACADVFDRVKLMEAAKQLVKDDVCAVRQDAVISFAALATDEDLDFVKELSRSQYFVERMTAATLIGLLDTTKFVDVLSALGSDHVINVRLAVARVVRNLDLGALTELKEALANDPDPDVRSV